MKGKMHKHARKEAQNLCLFIPSPVCPAFHFFALSPLFRCINGENTQLSSAVVWCSEARGSCYQASFKLYIKIRKLLFNSTVDFSIIL